MVGGVGGGWWVVVSSCAFSDRLWPKPRPWHLDLGPSRSTNPLSLSLDNTLRLSLYVLPDEKPPNFIAHLRKDLYSRLFLVDNKCLYSSMLGHGI